MASATASPTKATSGSPWAERVGRGYRLYVLAVLIAIYTFNFVDRQILGILAPAIKAELRLSDLQLGMLGGLAFALFYTGLGLPIAWLADRWSRTGVMTVALTVWSGFTAVCGLATGYPTLFLARMGVGAGEAGGVAPAYSLVSEYFPVRERARALAAYSFGIPIGSALGVMFGGLIASAVNWRFAFFSVGLAGLLLAPVLKFTVREPVRPARQGAGDRPPGLATTFASLVRKPTFWLISTGAAFSSTFAYGSAFWLPSYFGRTLHLNTHQTALYYGTIILVGGMLGVWAGGSVADRFGQGRRSVYVLAPALAFLAAGPLFLAALTTHSLVAAFALFLLPQALSLFWLGPVITAVQHLVPAAQRSSASACFLFVNNLIGLGFGSVFFGALSDALKPTFGADSLKYAIVSGLGFYLASAALLGLASRRIGRDWLD
jgi:predicted MFS family arabinose efflux permease